VNMRQTLKLVARKCDKWWFAARRCVKRAGHSVRTICAAINQRLQMHRGDGAVLFHAGLEFHQHRMPPAMAVEKLPSRASKVIFTGRSRNQRRLRDNNFMIERIAFFRRTRRRSEVAITRICPRGASGKTFAKSFVQVMRWFAWTTRLLIFLRDSFIATAACCSIAKCVLP